MGQISTFLIADVRGYTRFTAERGDDAAARLSLKLASLAQEGVSAHEGEVIELRGDEVLAVFASARQALRAAVTLQTSFREATRADPSLPLPVGIGLDAGEAVSIGDGFRGTALNLAARLCSLAGPGEVLASDGVIHLARKVEGIEYTERGVAQLKGFDDPVRVMQVTLSESRLAGPSSDDSLMTAPLPIQRLSIGGFLGSLPDGRLVARQGELQRLVDAIDAVAGSRGRVVLLAGEPGVGKTRLAQEVTLQVRNRGFLVACGRCYEAEQALPYYPFLEALSTLLSVAPDAVRREAPQRWPYLTCLLPDQLDIPLPMSAETQEEHQRLFRSVAAFVQAAAERTPVALLLDDLHWADASSLKLLHHLATATASHSVLLLGTYRDVEVGRQHPLEAALRDLDRERLAERVMLRRLDGQGTRALIAETMGATEISDEFTTLVRSRTEGNPFFVQQVLRVLVERGDVYREDGRWERKEIVEIDVPESVRSVIGQRVSRLSEPAQAILQEASVLGQAFTFDDLQALSGLAEPEIEEALAAAARAGLLRETAHDAYGFDHALTRQTLYGELTGRRRRRLHLAVGEALERLPARIQRRRASELAWHFLQADEAERALRYALLAGDEATLAFAHAEAELQFRTTLELARELGDEPSLAAALEKLGAVLHTLGRYDEALATLEDVTRRYRSLGDVEGELRAVAVLGRIYARRASPEEGIRRIQSLLSGLGDAAPSSGLASLYLGLARLYFASGRYEEQLAAAERAGELARSVGDQRVLAAAEGRRGTALAMMGDGQMALPVYESAIELAEAVGDLDTLSSTLNNISVVYRTRGNVGRWRHYVERALEVAERLGDPSNLVFMLGALAWVEVVEGNWETARAHAERSLAMSMSLGVTWDANIPRCVLGWLALYQGDHTTGEQYVTEALAISEQSGDAQGIAMSHQFLAQGEQLYGRPEAAIARLEPLLDLPVGVLQGTFNPMPVLAEAYLVVGESDRAGELIVHTLDRAAAEDDRPSQIDALRVRGMVLREHGEWPEADASFASAVALARAMPWPFAEARTLLERGRLAQQRGDQTAAREHLESAQAIFLRLGARPLIARTEQALSATGVPPSK